MNKSPLEFVALEVPVGESKTHEHELVRHDGIVGVGRNNGFERLIRVIAWIEVVACGDSLQEARWVVFDAAAQNGNCHCDTGQQDRGADGESHAGPGCDGSFDIHIACLFEFAQVGGSQLLSRRWVDLAFRDLLVELFEVESSLAGLVAGLRHCVPAGSDDRVLDIPAATPTASTAAGISHRAAVSMPNGGSSSWEPE